MRKILVSKRAKRWNRKFREHLPSDLVL